ncbi:sensor histidine kinase [Micromonospora chersina]|uniref:sensor histidine kinase n=1 Tax=Micromonospora chersina TaxID=47854 RepID=UPI003718FAA4
MAAGLLACGFVRIPRTDIALAAALAAGSLASLLSDGSATVTLVAQLVAALSLAFRRVNPFVPTLATLAATVITLLITGTGPGDVFYLAIWIVGSYACGAHLPFRQSLVALALWWVTLVVSAQSGFGWGDVVFMGTLTLGAWAPGVAARRSERARRAAAELAESREREAKQAVADERARIARELHDIVAHAIGIMVVHAGAAQELLVDHPARAREALDTVQQAGEDAVTELRRMLGLLRAVDESATAPLPRLAQLDALVATARGAGLAVDVEPQGDLDALPPAVDLTAYRVLQEALTNAVKHAPGASVRVGLRRTARELEVSVVNTHVALGGQRVPGSAAGTGHGLIGLRERVTIFGGRFDAAADETGGFRVSATIPLQYQAPTAATGRGR